MSSQLAKFARGATQPVTLTTSSGAPVDSLTASLTDGNGDILLKDGVLIDHMAHFDRERIPERVVHAKGAGAHGEFVCHDDLSSVTKAHPFGEKGRRTPVFVRFSTVGGESGSADTARDPRGFAIKFYTPEGNWDLVGNNTPIFFIRDPILFPSFIHTQKRNPVTNLKDPDAMWDFISLRPETTHQVMFLFSDRGTPDGYRKMNGYGSHTYKFVNAGGEVTYVKFHFKTDQKVKNLSPEEAGRLAGEDPDYATRDLFAAIERGEMPSWTLEVQLMTVDQAERCSFNPFDVTKVWPHAEFPPRVVGRMTLNRNPGSYFAEVEQSAFAPSNLIPGIEPSPDRMLQGRLFSYADTHRHRLGPNHIQIPINCPYAARVANMQRGGAMTVQGDQPGAPNYFPNSFGGPQPKAAAAWSGHGTDTRVKGKEARRTDTGDEDNFSQAAAFYRKTLDAPARDRLIANIAGSLKDAQLFIQDRAVGNFAKVDKDFGAKLAEALAKARKGKM